MISKFMEFCKKPFTWGAYLKLCAGIMAAYAAVFGVVFGVPALKDWISERMSKTADPETYRILSDED